MKNETNCDCIMVGRGSYGNPWIFSEIKAAFNRQTTALPTLPEKGGTALRHIALFREKFGEKHAAREMKKHAAWYIKGIPGASLLRDKIFRAQSSMELEDAVKAVFGL
jgi:tRNA-dihydrouridine synthase B